MPAPQPVEEGRHWAGSCSFFAHACRSGQHQRLPLTTTVHRPPSTVHRSVHCPPAHPSFIACSQTFRRLSLPAFHCLPPLLCQQSQSFFFSLVIAPPWSKRRPSHHLHLFHLIPPFDADKSRTELPQSVFALPAISRPCRLIHGVYPGQRADGNSTTDTTPRRLRRAREHLTLQSALSSPFFRTNCLPLAFRPTPSSTVVGHLESSSATAARFPPHFHDSYA